MKRIFFISIIAISMLTITYAHSGRTDSNGGHYDRATGEYHYHNGDYTESYEESNEAESLEEVNTLIVDDTVYIDGLESKVNTLQEQIDAKQETIGKLNNEIDENFYEIEKLKDDKKLLHFIYWFVILCMGLAIWNLKKKEK